MKNIFTLLISCLITIGGFSQESFKFELKMAPNTIYKTQMNTSTKGIINFVADSVFISQLKASGVNSPMKMEQNMNMLLTTTNDSIKENGEIPATIEYVEMVTSTLINDEPTPQVPSFEGMKIKGKYTDNQVFEIDTITGENVTEQIKMALKSTMENIQKQIDFPEEPIKIGDSFNNEIPMTIPMQGMSPFNIIIKTKYHLDSIKDNTAFFNVEQNITLSTEQEQFNMTATGSGTGLAEYNISGYFLTKYETTLPMELNMQVNEELTINMVMDTHSSLIVSMEK